MFDFVFGAGQFGHIELECNWVDFFWDIGENLMEKVLDFWTLFLITSFLFFVFLSFLFLSLSILLMLNGFLYSYRPGPLIPLNSHLSATNPLTHHKNPHHICQPSHKKPEKNVKSVYQFTNAWIIYSVIALLIVIFSIFHLNNWKKSFLCLKIAFDGKCRCR